MNFLTRMVCVLSLVLVSGFADARNGGPAPGTPQEISELAQAILSLGPNVDPQEAMRAAQVTYGYTYQLAQEYQITDRPLIHNTKVNLGSKPRGLCWHWAEDIEARLKQETFRTLDIHRAVANAFNIRLEHSTSIISQKGDPFEKGIVLDPWRKGGVLFWSPTLEDHRYIWMSRADVIDRKRDQKKGRYSKKGTARTQQLRTRYR